MAIVSTAQTNSIGEGYELCEGRYRIESRLGHGGMASVWLGCDQRLGRPVAIKVLSDTLATEPGYVERFRREARLAAGLSHPNLVKVFDFEPDGRPALIMEYIEGGTLDEAARDSTTVIEPEALGSQLLGALENIHAAGIVHRDVKPANVLINDDGRAMLTDFGIAQPEDATRITKTGEVIGTIAYMAPEVREGERATPQSDLYSVGIVLRDHLGGDSSASVRRLVERLTDPKPSRRPPSARRALAYLAPSGRRVSAEAHPAVVKTEPYDVVEPGDETQTRDETQTHDEPLPYDESRPHDEPPPHDPPPRERDTAEWDALGAPLSETGPREPREPFAAPPARREYAIGGRHVVAGLALLAAVIAAIAIATAGGSEEGGSETAASGSGDSAEESSPAEEPAQEPTEPQPVASAVPEPKPNADPATGAQLEQEAYSLLQSGDADGAVAAYERALREFPPDARTPEAFGQYPNYAYALYSYADALLQTGRADEAVAVLEERLQFPDQRDTVEALLAEAQAAAGE